MNGSSVQNPKTTNPAALLGLALIALSTLSLTHGCSSTRTYDGALSANYSRLTVDNRAPWPCAVAITSANNNPNQSAVWANIQSQQSLTWDLIPGNYQLTAVTAQDAQFQTSYYAPPAAHRRWPIINRQNPLPAN